MAIVALSRQVAAYGDEVAQKAADLLGYSFVTRQDIENRIMDLGFPPEKMPKFDERKPGFFASLTKDRDEYYNLACYAVLEAASKGNVVIIGRGAFEILKNVKNQISARIISNKELRIQRLMKEFEWSEKQAVQRIEESDANREGFHKNFFNVDVAAPENYSLLLNTGKLEIIQAAELLAQLVKTKVTPQMEEEGKKQISDKLKAQTAINKLVFEYKLKIEFLHAEVKDDVLEIYGVTDSAALAQQAVRIVQEELPEYEVKSAISVVHDFKNYQ